MSTGDDWRTTFRPDVPSPARMYNYFLGGKDNYPADREAAADGSVHEVAQAIDPGIRVLYVDHDPVVLAHGRHMLHGVRGTAIIWRDLLEPAAILTDPELRDLIRLDEPVAVMLLAVVHFIGGACVWPIGTALVLGFGAYFASMSDAAQSAAYVWRGVWILVGVLALIVWAFRFTLPESPRYLATHGRGDEAIRCSAASALPARRSRCRPMRRATPRATRSASCSRCSRAVSSPG